MSFPRVGTVPAASRSTSGHTLVRVGLRAPAARGPGMARREVSGTTGREVSGMARRSCQVLVAAALCTVLSLSAPRGAHAQRFDQMARSARGVVTSPHRLATDAGQLMLEAGGTAADAAVAAAFALCVLEPTSTGLGGGSLALVRTSDGRVDGIDGSMLAVGGGRAGIPGTVAALVRLHEEHGRLPLGDVVAPAIDLALEGYRLLDQEAVSLSEVAGDLSRSRTASATFLGRDGSLPRGGSRLVQPDLAATLQSIARDGRAGFYGGQVAQRIAADPGAHGGGLTVAALAAYRATRLPTLRGTYRDVSVVAPGTPAAAAGLVRALALLEALDPAAFDQPGWAAAVAGAAALGTASDDPETDPGTEAGSTLASWLGDPRSAGLVGGGEELGARSRAGSALVAADATGLLVVVGSTMGDVAGLRTASAGLGFLYGAAVGRPTAEGRARSWISPVLVVRPDGSPSLAMAASGDAEGVAALARIISEAVDRRVPLMEALTAPRVHLRPAGRLAVSTRPTAGWTTAQITSLVERGFALEELADPAAFGRVFAVRYFPRLGEWEGAADPASDGTARGPRPPGP